MSNIRKRQTLEYQRGYADAKKIYERKKGEWDDIGGIIRWGCPVCHHAYETKYNFCPNCGDRKR